MATLIVETSRGPVEVPLAEAPRADVVELARGGNPEALTLLLTGGVPAWVDRAGRRMRRGT